MSAMDTSVLQQQLQGDPDYLDTMKAIQQMNAAGGVWQGSPAFAKLQALNQKYASQLPHGYGIGFDGQLHQDAFMNRHATALSAISMIPAGLGVASGLAAGDLTGTGAGTAASGAATGHNPVGSVVGDSAKSGALADMLPGAEFGSPLASFLKKLALGLAPVGAGLAAHALGPATPQPPQVPDELKQLLASAMKRMSDQQPLVDRVNAGELAGLPRLQ